MMKNYLLIFFTSLLTVVNLTAQNNIQLNIHNKLGNEPFALEVGVVNNMAHDFMVTRMQYYISEISVIHDGGTETGIEDLWVLVNAGTAEISTIDLGDHEIEQVEGVVFHIGVDEAHNHLDPASWPETHPLAPQHPSMHWGWNSGYRFIAFEGEGGSNYNQAIELHGLGDENYFRIELEMSAEAVENQINIDVEADFTRVVENINVNAGVLVHGNYGAAKIAIENFRDYVFSVAQTTAVIDENEISSFDIFPNPAVDGKASFVVSASNDGQYQVVLTDVLGRNVQQFSGVFPGEIVRFDLKNPGLYNISLLANDQVLLTKRLISK